MASKTSSQPHVPTSIPNREVLLSLAQDLPDVWNTSSDMGLKQRIARILIEEIVANIDTGDERSGLGGPLGGWSTH